MPESSAIATAPVAAAAVRALASAFSAKVSPTSGAELDLVGQRLELLVADQPAELAELVRIARREDHRGADAAPS